MDFTFTPEQIAWRQEVRDWLIENLGENHPGGDFDTETTDGHAFAKQFWHKLAEKGWLTMAWPKEYGGGGAGIIEQMIFNEEYGYFRAPYLGPGIHFIGPSIMIAGTEEQKKKYLPEIARAEKEWCQGFSEPDTGSDLASLQCRAVEDGDDYVVNGTKIWTSFGHHADYCYLAVRTDEDAPKHKGISLLLVDMDSPGLTMTPIVNMAGIHSFNQVFFDDVRVPKKNMLGPKNRGWYTMMTTLGFERSMVSTSSGVRRTLDDIIDFAKTTIDGDGKPLASNPVVAGKLAQMAIEVEVSRLLAYQTASVQQHRKVPDKEGSYAKLIATDLLAKVAEVGMETIGPYSPLTGDDPHAELRGRIQRAYLTSISTKIAGGSSEIQRSIIATRGLGMPR